MNKVKEPTVKVKTMRWYDRSGNPQNFIPKKDGSGDRPTTLTDARKFGWLPSVTTILNVVHKPNLQDWLIMQAVNAVMLTPQKKGETMEAFMERVLVTERVQDRESKTAADRGTQIHKAIEQAINREQFEDRWKPYVESVFPVLESLGRIAWSEKIVVGDGYAGKCDIGMETDRHLMILDFKSTKKVPNESYRDHRMQLAAYAKAVGNTADKPVMTGNLYLSTEHPGEVNLCLNPNWEEDYECGFIKARDLWCYMNDYRP